MMFGTREAFPYFECGACGCVQISDIPPDLSRFYPEAYYSYRPAGRWKALIKGAWLPEPFTAAVAVKRMLSLVPPLKVAPAWVSRAGLPWDADILEVGCGAGERLRALRSLGFRKLTGTDPFLPTEMTLDGIRLLKRDLRDVDGSFDLVMLHHAFEHMPDQDATLADLRRLLRPGGTVLLRIPLASSFAWRHYGPDWVQLDPPRHLFLHTDRSLETLAARHRLRVVDRFRDSYEFQFWGSEQYRRDIPLRSERSYAQNKRVSVFSASDIRAFSRRSRQLNAEGQGDQGVFYLKAF